MRPGWVAAGALATLYFLDNYRPQLSGGAPSGGHLSLTGLNGVIAWAIIGGAAGLLTRSAGKGIAVGVLAAVVGTFVDIPLPSGDLMGRLPELAVGFLFALCAVGTVVLVHYLAPGWMLRQFSRPARWGWSLSDWLWSVEDRVNDASSERLQKRSLAAARSAASGARGLRQLWRLGGKLPLVQAAAHGTMRAVHARPRPLTRLSQLRPGRDHRSATRALGGRGELDERQRPGSGTAGRVTADLDAFERRAVAFRAEMEKVR